MLYCPRCVQPVPPDATQCPNCRYDIPAAARSGPRSAPEQGAEVEPVARSVRPGGVTTVAPADQTGRIAPVPDEDYSLIPGFTQGPSQVRAPAEEPQRSRWAIGGAVVICVAVLAVIAFLVGSRIGHRGTPDSKPAPSVSTSASGPGPSTAPSGRHGLTQASVIAHYLNRSGHARQRIGAAINAINGCSNIASAVTALDKAAKVRAHIVTSLATTDVSALGHGTSAIHDLGRAMRASARADRHYARWGRAVIGCRGHAPHNAEFQAAQRSDAAATAAKRRFAGEWNPIAAMYGLPKQNANTI